MKLAINLFSIQKSNFIAFLYFFYFLMQSSDLSFDFGSGLAETLTLLMPKILKSIESPNKKRPDEKKIFFTTLLPNFKVFVQKCTSRNVDYSHLNAFFCMDNNHFSTNSVYLCLSIFSCISVQYYCPYFRWLRIFNFPYTFYSGSFIVISLQR